MDYANKKTTTPDTGVVASAEGEIWTPDQGLMSYQHIPHKNTPVQVE